MKKLTLILLVFFNSYFSVGQNDSLQNEKLREISFGFPLFPILNFENTNDFLLIQSITNPYQIIYPLYIPVNLSYKKIISDVNKKRIGLIINKTNMRNLERLNSSLLRTTTSGILFISAYCGTERKINNSKRFQISLAGDIVFGLLELYYPEKSNIFSRKFMYGIDGGISISYYFSEKFFIESEILILPYIYAGKAVKEYNMGNYNTYLIANTFGGGISATKFGGVNLGYKFHK